VTEGGQRLRSVVLVAALVAGTSYVISWSLPLSLAAHVTWKGAGVALLALYAALSARNLDGWLISLALALGALGDVLLDALGTISGALTFLAGDVVAIGLYLRNRRDTPTLGQSLLALSLVPAVIAVASSLAANPWRATYVFIYGLGVALMAATAWTSRFPQDRTGIGALMVVGANILLFARFGPLPHAPGINLAIWILYFGGQTLICLGVTRTLRELGPRPLVSAL
jgi:uncharacterized membrane protein YhhN